MRAISTEKQIPEIDNSKCIKCGQCMEICQNNAIEKIQNQACKKCIKYCLEYDVPCSFYRYIINNQKCNSCGQCILFCNKQAISRNYYSKNKYEFSLKKY